MILAAGLIAVSRVLQSPYGDTKAANAGEYPPEQSMNLRATNEANLRMYCAPSAGNSSHYRHGSLTTSYETDHIVPPITDRADFWRYCTKLSSKTK